MVCTSHLFSLYEEDIRKNLGDVEFDIADENLQARIRATILMYFSNKFNWLLVSTGNKSEIGVGYCTLYGDTNGGKNIPGDLFKTQIYEISNWINKDKEVIPKGIIERPPTAELRENQKDSDSLPSYEILDIILEDIVKYGIGSDLKHLEEKKISPETINKVRKLHMIEIIATLYQAVNNGEFEKVTNHFEKLTGHPPESVESFLKHN